MIILQQKLIKKDKIFNLLNIYLLTFTRAHAKIYFGEVFATDGIAS